MAEGDSVTIWIRQLKIGDADAAQQLWNRYFERLVRLAQRRLVGAPCQMADEEDVALSAFNSVCIRAAEGKFPKLDDRQDLWRLLVTITVRKALAQRKYANRQKRRPGAEAIDPLRVEGGPVALRVEAQRRIPHVEGTTVLRRRGAGRGPVGEDAPVWQERRVQPVEGP